MIQREMLGNIITSITAGKVLRVNMCVRLDKPKLSVVNLKSSNPDPITEWNSVEYIASVLASNLE